MTPLTQQWWWVIDDVGSKEKPDCVQSFTGCTHESLTYSQFSLSWTDAYLPELSSPPPWSPPPAPASLSLLVPTSPSFAWLAPVAQTSRNADWSSTRAVAWEPLRALMKAKSSSHPRALQPVEYIHQNFFGLKMRKVGNARVKPPLLQVSSSKKELVCQTCALLCSVETAFLSSSFGSTPRPLVQSPLSPQPEHLKIRSIQGFSQPTAIPVR